MDIGKQKIAIIGIGYVGLPLAVEFGRIRPVIGFDVSEARIAELRSGRDSTLEVTAGDLAAARHLEFNSDSRKLEGCGIFIVTVPVMKHAVNIDLPRASNQLLDTKPQTVRLAVDSDGGYFWNDLAVDDGQLAERLRAAAMQEPQPELHLRADKNVRYERVAQAMATAQRSGLRKIGFVTEPQSP